jgi:hypothetical protein
MFRPTVLAAILSLLVISGCNRSATVAPKEQPDDTATFLIGKWKDDNGSITEYRADGTFTSPEITSVNGKVTDTKITEGSYRIVGPRQIEMKFRIEAFAKKPEYTTRVTIKEITAERLVTVNDETGATSTSNRVRE